MQLITGVCCIETICSSGLLLYCSAHLFLIFSIFQGEPSKKKATPWTEEERNAAWESLGGFVQLKSYPKKTDIMKAMEKHPALRNREWRNIKDFISHRIRKAKATK